MSKRKGGNRKSGPQQGQSGAAVMYQHADDGTPEEVLDKAREDQLNAILAPAVESSDPLGIDYPAQDPEPEPETPITPTQEQGQPPAAPEAPAPTVDKFGDKSKDDVVQAYTELEQRLGQQGQEIGDYRKFFDQYAQQHIMQGNQPPPPPAAPDGEPSPQDVELLNKMLGNPGQFVADLKKEWMGELNDMGQKQVVGKLWQENQQVIMSPQFAEWERHNVPRHVAEQAQADPHVFNFIMNSYRASAGATNPQQAKQQAQSEMATKVKTVAAATGAPPSNRQTGEKIYSRREIMKMMQTDPQRYAREANEIGRAYKEGRVRD